MQKLCCVRTRQQFSASLDYFITSSPPHLHQFSTISGGNCINYVNVTKQKLNTKSSTTAELVGADDATTMMLWTKLFMEEQGYKIEENVLYQDNKSAILLEKNGRKSMGKQSPSLNVQYFFISDQVNQGNLNVKYWIAPRIMHLFRIYLHYISFALHLHFA